MHRVQVREEVRRLAAAGLADPAIGRIMGLPRTTVRDMRSRPRTEPALCPRCWRPGRSAAPTAGEYAELLGLYLGDGHISQFARTQRLRISLDARHEQVVADVAALLGRCFGGNRVGLTRADGGATAVLSVYSRHLGCLLPQHGPGRKNERTIALEPWQRALIRAAPWSFLRGCVHSDGCFFVNRTGRYRYLSVDFHNRSRGILDAFCATCDLVGVEYRRYARYVRVYRRESVALFAAFVGAKR